MNLNFSGFTPGNRTSTVFWLSVKQIFDLSIYLTTLAIELKEMNHITDIFTGTALTANFNNRHGRGWQQMPKDVDLCLRLSGNVDAGGVTPPVGQPRRDLMEDSEIIF